MALEYTQRAEEATDSEVREFFYRVRNSWIRAANHQEVLEGAKGIIVEGGPVRDIGWAADRVHGENVVRLTEVVHGYTGPCDVVAVWEGLAWLRERYRERPYRLPRCEFIDICARRFRRSNLACGGLGQHRVQGKRGITAEIDAAW